MIDHVTLKLIHQTAVVLSISGFALRGGLMLTGSSLLQATWMRTWPHLIDTLLLASGIWMAINLRLDPLSNPWLGAKLVSLLLYISLGFVALRLGRTRRIRVIALIGAIACFAYIALVAIRRSVLPF